MIAHDEGRKLLLAQHAQLRVFIGILESAGSAVLSAGDRGAQRLLPPLLAAIEKLQLHFDAHLTAEEAILEPVLARIDAWGPLRLDALHAEHTHQRAVLSALPTANGPALSPHEVARNAVALAEDLLVDMASEERDLLAVLRDDTICVDQSDG
jgi:hypothetical protein